MACSTFSKSAEGSLCHSATILNDNVYRPDVDTSAVDERKLMRRVDLRIIPWLTLLYLLNFLDRGSIGNAKLYHLLPDIGINDKQYLIALTVFFFPYALFEPVSNVLLRRLRPSIWLPILMFLWGVAMTLHGIIKNYGDLIVLRVFLGLFEAGMYPGIVFYISSWYKRSEMGTRISIFFSATTIAGAFSGLLAAAIANMDGVGGKPGWAWIFILEGLGTIIFAVISFWMIEDFPDTARFLTEEERIVIIRRLQDDSKHSAAGESFKKQYVWSSLRDWKTYVAMLMFMGFDGPLYAFSLFLPSIINQLGFKATEANLLSVPVYIWGCIITCGIGFLGDRFQNRSFINISLFGVGLVAYVILLVSKTPALSYFATYLAVSAIYPTIPNSVAWVGSNTEGAYKRSVTFGMAIMAGNIQGAVTANVYRAHDQPYYRLGHGVVFAYIAIGFFSSIVYVVLLKRENERRERGERDEVIQGVSNAYGNARNGVYESIEAAKNEKGDEWSGFRYSL